MSHDPGVHVYLSQEKREAERLERVLANHETPMHWKFETSYIALYYYIILY